MTCLIGKLPLTHSAGGEGTNEIILAFHWWYGGGVSNGYQTYSILIFSRHHHQLTTMESVQESSQAGVRQAAGVMTGETTRYLINSLLPKGSRVTLTASFQVSRMTQHQNRK